MPTAAVSSSRASSSGPDGASSSGASTPLLLGPALHRRPYPEEGPPLAVRRHVGRDIPDTGRDVRLEGPPPQPDGCEGQGRTLFSAPIPTLCPFYQEAPPQKSGTGILKGRRGKRREDAALLSAKNVKGYTRVSFSPLRRKPYRQPTQGRRKKRIKSRSNPNRRRRCGT